MKAEQGMVSDVGIYGGLAFNPLALKSVPTDNGLGADPSKIKFVSLRMMNNSIMRISRNWA